MNGAGPNLRVHCGQMLLRTLAVLLPLVLLLGCPPANQCASDKECFKDQQCVANRCVPRAGGAAGGSTSGGTAGGNTSGGAGGGVVAGGSAGGSAGGAIDGESCDRPAALGLPGSVIATTVGAANDVALRCTGFGNPGPDRVYAVTVPAGQRLVASVTPTVLDAGLLFDPSLSIVLGPAASCASTDAGVCLAGGDERGADTVAWLNTSTSPEDVFLVVDSSLTTPDENSGVTFQGEYELTARLELPGAGDRCETAEPLMGAGSVASSLAGDGPDYRFSPSEGCAFQAGPDHAFSIEVPAGERLTATATPTAADGGLDVVVNLVRGPASTCAMTPAACLGSGDRGFRGDPDSATWVNFDAAPETVFVVVGSYASTTPDDAFTLTTTIQPLPPGDVCIAPVALVPGTPLLGETLTGYGNDVEDGAGCAWAGFAGTGADRFYSVTVPAGQQLRVTVTPQASLDTLLSFVDAAAVCAQPFECLLGDVGTQAPVGQADTLSFTNRAATPRELVVVVDSRANTTGTFDLVATLGAPPAGDFCGVAAALTLNQLVQGTTVGASNDYESGRHCASGVTGPDLVYTFEVPPHERASVTVTPTSGDGGFNPSLSLVPAPASRCEATPPVCVGAVDAVFGSAIPRTATTFNGGTTPLPLFAIVDGANGGAGSFSLSVTSGAAAANDVCSTTAVTLPVMPSASMQPLGGQTLIGFSRDYACVEAASGGDRVYTATVGQLENLTVTVTPTPTRADAGSFDPVLSIIDGPASACDSVDQVCLDARDEGSEADAEVATLNNAGAARQVFVVVGAYESAPLDSTFSIVAVSRPTLDGDLCEKPIAIPMTGSRTGTLVDLIRDYDFSNKQTPPAVDGGQGLVACMNSSGADAVYALTFTSSLTVLVTPDPSSDVVLNLLDGPATSCGAAVGCLVSADVGGVGGAEALSFRSGAGQPRTVFLVVSRYTPGPMTFTLSATLN